MQVKDLTLEQLKSLIREVVDEMLEEVRVDSDEEKEIRPEIKEELLKRRSLRQSGKSTLLSSEEVMSQLGIDS